MVLTDLLAVVLLVFGVAVLQHVKGLVRAEVEPRALRVGKRGRDALGAHARANVQVAPDGADGDGQIKACSRLGFGSGSGFDFGFGLG